MKEIITKNNISLVIIELPPKAHRPTNNMVSHQIDYLIDFIQITVQDAYIIRELWGEKFKIINFLKDLTDDEAENFVQRIGLSKGTILDDGTILEADVNFGWKNYINNNTIQPAEFHSPKDSFLSLLQENGLNTDKNLLILQRI
jgi:hypothetical protein